jgi:hypothetical protein
MDLTVINLPVAIRPTTTIDGFGITGGSSYKSRTRASSNYSWSINNCRLR